MNFMTKVMLVLLLAYIIFSSPDTEYNIDAGCSYENDTLTCHASSIDKNDTIENDTVKAWYEVTE